MVYDGADAGWLSLCHVALWKQNLYLAVAVGVATGSHSILSLQRFVTTRYGLPADTTLPFAHVSVCSSLGRLIHVSYMTWIAGRLSSSLVRILRSAGISTCRSAKTNWRR